LHNLKAIYSALGDWARALAAAERVLLLIPDAVEELRDRGMLPARLGEGAALAAAERVLLRIPDAVEELRDRGMLHARLGHGHAAVRDWETYLRRAPEAADAGQVEGRPRALPQALAALN